MEKTLTFDEFWKLTDPNEHKGNGPSHHPCCDVWTTRSSKAARETHTKRTPWRNLAATFDKAAIGKKQALLAKMIEECWRVPIVLNERCGNRPSATIQQRSAFRHHQPDQLPQDLQASLAPPNFIMTSLNPPNNPGICTFSHYQPYIQCAILFSKCNISRTSLFSRKMANDKKPTCQP